MYNEQPDALARRIDELERELADARLILAALVRQHGGVLRVQATELARVAGELERVDDPVTGDIVYRLRD